MTLINRFDVVESIANKFGVPDVNNDAARIEFVKKVVEQLCYYYPHEGWGTKRSSAGAPPSKDVVCTKFPFEGADIQDGNTGQLCWNVHNAQNDPHWAAQEPYWFTYPPVNHLASEQHSDVPSVEQPNLGEVLTDIRKQLADLQNLIILHCIPSSTPAQAPTYEGSATIPYLGTARFLMTPKK